MGATGTLDVIIANQSLIREQWLSHEEAQRITLDFKQRFGSKHFTLACHAALPFYITPDLVNLININFLSNEGIPWIAEADFLLSPLCRHLRDNLFEVEPAVREALLGQLQSNPRFSWQRFADLSKFLLAYLDKRERTEEKYLIRCQRWICESYINPDKVVGEMVDFLRLCLAGKSDNLSNIGNQLYVATTAELLGGTLERTNLHEEYERLTNGLKLLAELHYGSDTELITNLLREAADQPLKPKRFTLLSPEFNKWLDDHLRSGSTRPGFEEEIATAVNEEVPVEDGTPNLQALQDFSVPICHPTTKAQIGTGIIISESGMIVTSRLVISKVAVGNLSTNQLEVIIKFPQARGRPIPERRANVLTYIRDYEDDIALLQVIEGKVPIPIKQLPSLGSARNSIGNPFRSFTFSESQGYNPHYIEGKILGFEETPPVRDGFFQSPPLLIGGLSATKEHCGAAVLDVSRNLIVGFISEAKASDRPENLDAALATDSAVLAFHPFNLPVHDVLPDEGKRIQGAFHRNEVVVFLGPASSRWAGLPDFSNLIKSLGRHAGINLPTANASIADQLLEVAQLYDHRLGREQLIDYLHKELDAKDKEPSPAHALLASLPLSVFCVTAYDTLLEQAMDKANKLYDVLTEHQPNSKSHNNVEIIKLFGDLAHASEIVITENDFRMYIKSHPKMIELLYKVTKNKVALFIGYDGPDPFIYRLLDGLNQSSTSRFDAYAALCNAQLWEITGMQRRGIKPVNLRSDSDESAIQTLEKWLQSIAPDSPIHEGDIVEGVVIDILEQELVISLPYGLKGVAPKEEFINQGGSLAVARGDTISVYVISFKATGEQILLSNIYNARERAMARILEALETQETLSGRVTDRIKGGLNVNIFGQNAFLPGSQLDVRPVRDMESFVGQKIDIRVLKVNRKRGNIVVSRKVIIEQDADIKRSETLADLEEGIVVTGIIKNITDYGAFINLGGIDGLLHIIDMSWGHITSPNDILKVGDTIQVKVLKFDEKKERISLGYKQLVPDPWQTAKERYKIGARVSGKVGSITDYGVFLELEPGVEALMHVTEMAWGKRLKHPSKRVSVGQEIEVAVLEVDQENRRISVSMRELKPDPWANLSERYQVGSFITGKIVSLTDFGAFVEIEEGIDGLIHVSDISHQKRIKHPSEVLKKGQIVDVVVISIDFDNRRINLSIKDVLDSPLVSFIQEHRLWDLVDGEVVRFANFGAFIKLADGVEGLCHISELSDMRIDKLEDTLTIGQVLRFIIIKLNPIEKKIGLSARIDFYLNLIDRYIKAHKRGDEIDGKVELLLESGAFILIDDHLRLFCAAEDLNEYRIRMFENAIKIGQVLRFKIVEINDRRRYIKLSAIENYDEVLERFLKIYKEGNIVKGRIKGFLRSSVIVELPDGLEGLCLLSNLSEKKVSRPEELVSIGQVLYFEITRTSRSTGTIYLSARSIEQPEDLKW